MRFITQEALISLPETGITCTYSQEVISTKMINGQKTEQKISRDIEISSKMRTRKGWEVDCVIKNTSMILPSVLKKQEDLSMKVFNVLNELQIEMNQKGEVEVLLNHQEILGKWRVVLPGLEKQYIGGGGKAYLRGVTNKINSSAGIIEDLKQHRMLGLLFNGLYHEHSDRETNRSKRQNRISNLAFNLSVPIEETILLKENNDDEVVLEIKGIYNREDQLEGKITKALLRENIYDGAPFVVEKYEGVYSFNQKDRFLNNAILQIKTSCGNKYSKTISYKLVRN